MKGPWRFALAIGVYALAWMLPSEVSQSLISWHAVPGWEATRVALSPIWHYRYHGDLVSGEGPFAALSVLSAFTNLIFVAAAVIALINRRLVGRKLEVLVWVATIVNSHWFVLSLPNVAWLRIGYYAWFASYALLGVALHHAISSTGASAAQHTLGAGAQIGVRKGPAV